MQFTTLKSLVNTSKSVCYALCFLSLITLIITSGCSDMKDNLIPRKTIFGNPDKAAPEISRDARHIAYLAPKDGVLNVYVAKTDDIKSAKPITDDKKRGIRFYFWSYDNKHIIYAQDKEGDENWRLYSVDVETLETKGLTDFDKVQAQILQTSYKYPDEIIVGLNKRVKEYHDVYRLNIKTGKLDLMYQNDQYIGITVDDNYDIRFMSKLLPDASEEVYKMKEDGTEELFMTIPKEDGLTTRIFDFDKSGQNAYFISSIDRNTAGLFLLDTNTKEQKLIFANEKADISSIMTDEKEKTLQAISYTYTKKEKHFIEDKVKDDFEYLATIDSGEVNLASSDLENNIWIVSYFSDTSPTKYYIYNRAEKKADFLFTVREDLAKYQLAKMHPVVIKSRDGLDLVSYLTLPNNSLNNNESLKPKKPLPMVLLVHGGPNARDYWGIDGEHQWLANRGYAVLSVNYRGSTGFGKEFIAAGYGQWAAKMHDDLIDAVNWAIDEKIALPDKVAIMGGSYGGYATLVGLTFTPDVFACGVDIVGMSNLITTLTSMPPYWKPALDAMILNAGGDPRTEEGRKILASKSPINKVDNIKKPLLIAQGANDSRVVKAESDQIVEKIQSKGIPVTYLLYPDEGHGFARPENRLSFYAVAEEFLNNNLGGKVEPIKYDFQNSSIEIDAGEDKN